MVDSTLALESSSAINPLPGINLMSSCVHRL
ncbi:unnamed protein product [Linum tenue]|uniref:Uncharacterized protein n=1 Tax=Linum tenue TaxID=586396 RepID=A0AAV0KY17_9ROSI|nr:unnamed protein product [Linum tenue]